MLPCWLPPLPTVFLEWGDGRRRRLRWQQARRLWGGSDSDSVAVAAAAPSIARPPARRELRRCAGAGSALEPDLFYLLLRCWSCSAIHGLTNNQQGTQNAPPANSEVASVYAFYFEVVRAAVRCGWCVRVGVLAAGKVAGIQVLFVY